MHRIRAVDQRLADIEEPEDARARAAWAQARFAWNS